MSIVEALSNPYLPEEYRAMGNAILGQQMQSMQPMSPREQLELEMAQLELERMKNPTPTQQPLVNAGSGQIYDPNTQKWISAPQGQQAPNTQYVEGLGLINTDTGEVIRSYNTPKDAPQTVKTTREDGSEVVVQWDGDSGEWVPLQAPGGATSLAAPADLTESQARMTLFKSMQDETQPVLGQIEEVYNPANIRDAAARRTPLAGNFYQTPEGQRYQAAASAWAEGALRLATGAAATPEEFERTISTYFAQPGDTPETIQFKAQMREMYTRSVQRALGQNPEGKLSLPSPADFAKTVTPPSNDFSGMDMTGLLNFDIMTATPEQMDAWEARMKELQNGK